MHELKKALEEVHLKNEAGQRDFAYGEAIRVFRERLPDDVLETLEHLFKESYKNVFGRPSDGRYLLIKVSISIFVLSDTTQDLDSIELDGCDISYSPSFGLTKLIKC